MFPKKTTIKFLIIILLAMFILPAAHSVNIYSVNNAYAIVGEGIDKLAESPTECIGKEADIPRNCLFLEEPIGGKLGYDVYRVSCIKVDNKDVCTYTLLHSWAIPQGDRGPIQAILTEEPGKEYQGPFGLLYNYLGLVYGYMSGIIVGVAVLFVVVGGIQITTSAGDSGKLEAGKSRILKAIVGLILWFTASLILYTINPTFFAF